LKKNQALIAVCLLLAAVTLLCYWPVTNHSFISLDDRQYIVDNPHVKSGFTWAGFVWAFTSVYASNWHPLTWISHMVDCQLYGLNPAGHHLTSLMLHIANTLLLFALLRQMTRRLWSSALVAALFAWHPLHVESVAWASERKDVLSTLFRILTMMAYVRYAGESRVQGQDWEKKNPKSRSRSRGPESRRVLYTTHHPARYYILTLILFTLGLMSKPMLVTLP